MELNFLSIAELNNKAKATIHMSGKLGFNSEAAELMKLDSVSSFKVAIDGELSNYKSIFLLPTQVEDDNTVKLLKAGEYYSLSLASIFNKLEINYTDYKVIFDITVENYKEDVIYKLKKRAKIIQRTTTNSKEDIEE